MHRLSRWLIILAALYVSVGCNATHPPQAVQIEPSAASAPVAAPTMAAPVTPGIAAPQVSPNAVAHIAVLLPLNSSNTYLVKAAKAVENGFVAAYRAHPGALPVRIYSCSDESRDAVTAYQQALSDGAKVVVGPLTRNGVQALSALSSIPVPTLALNTIDNANPPDNLYYFGVPLEGEARQVARMAMANGMHVASIVRTNSPLSIRVAEAFGNEWIKLGGQVAVTKVFDGDTSIFSDLPINIGSMVFVAAPPDQARLFRPFLNAVLPVYATSQVFNGNTNRIMNYDLRDIQFVDMPWLLQPESPVVTPYPRPNPPIGVDLERLYALGIDAYRLMQVLYNNQIGTLPFKGVTGTISLGVNHQFDRQAVAAEFMQGLGLTPEAFNALNAAKKQ